MTINRDISGNKAEHVVVSQKSNPKNAMSFASQLAWTLVGISILLIILHLVMQYLNLVVFREQNGFVFELSNRLDLDDEISLPTWYSQILLFAIGTVAFMAAYLQNKRTSRRLWLIIGGLGLLLSIDEGSSFHELLLQSLHNMYFLDTAATVSSNAWWLIAPFIVLFGGILIWKVIRLLPKRTALLFVVGGTMVVIGGTVVDAVSVIVPITSFLHQGIFVAVEEGLELLGSIIVLYAIVDYIESHNHKLIHFTKNKLV